MILVTSSGGPWLKTPGRIGSSAIRGAGFDISRVDGRVVGSLASGHGENIIEQRITARAASETLERYGIEDTKEFLGDAIAWDLGLITVQYDIAKRTGSVEVL